MKQGGCGEREDSQAGKPYTRLEEAPGYGVCGRHQLPQHYIPVASFSRKTSLTIHY